MRVLLNWVDTGYGEKKPNPKRKAGPAPARKRAAVARPKPAPRPQSAAKPRELPAKPRKAPQDRATKRKAVRAGIIPRVAVPPRTLDLMRAHGGWPDMKKDWFTFGGVRWWPATAMEHTVIAYRGTKHFAEASRSADGIVEFVREGGPIKA